MINKNIIVYFYSHYTGNKHFVKFLKSYQKYEAGVSHILLICFKHISKKEINIIKKKILKKIKYQIYHDRTKNNDYGWETFYSVAKKFKNSNLLLLNGYSNILCNNYLKYFSENLKKKTILSATGSYESISYNAIRSQKDIYYPFRLIKLISNFKLFPNPHLRTNGLMINSKDLIYFLNNHIPITEKIDVWKLESGRNGCTNFFKKKDYKIKIINSDGKSFEEKNWKKSKTYALGDQTKLMIGDNRTNKFINLTKKEKKLKRKMIWGNNK